MTRNYLQELSTFMQTYFPQYEENIIKKGRKKHEVQYTKLRKDNLYEGIFFKINIEKDKNNYLASIFPIGIIDESTDFDFEVSNTWSHLGFLKLDYYNVFEMIGEYSFDDNDRQIPTLNTLKKELTDILIPKFDEWSKEYKDNKEVN